MKHNRIFMSVAMAALVLVSLCAVGVSMLSASAAQGSSSTPAVVGAPVGAGAPGVCSVDGTKLDLFIRVAADNSLVWKESPDGTTWPSTQTSLGGSLTAAPAAVSTAPNWMWVFARGTDGSVFYKYTGDDGATWTGWYPLGGHLATNTGPSVCSWGSGRLDVFVQGTDGAMWHKWLTGTTWSAWESLGGKLTSAPGATATGPSPNKIGVFVAGDNGSVYYKQWSGAWSSWVSVGGKTLPASTGYTSPAAYNWGASQLGWVVTGTDQNLYRNWVGSSSGYEGISAVLTSSPSATAKHSGVIDVFGRGSSGSFSALYQISYNYGGSGTWGTWTAIGGV